MSGTKFGCWFVMMLGLVGAGCEEKKAENLAPVAAALESAKPAAPKAVALEVDGATSKVTFVMQAPIEKISGEAPSSVSGELFVELSDLARSTGLIQVDLDKLSLFQEKREDEQGAFSERKKNDLQNEHARAWLEIAPDAPEDVRRANRFAEFKINRLEALSASDVAALTGAERRITATAVGDFRLHGRKNEKRAKVELTFQYAGEQLQTLRVRSSEPLAIGLDEYDVRPREAFGKLAQKTLDTLGSKVAKVAPIELDFSARPR